MLGYVLEAITGSPFEDSMRKAVLDPLGMHRTSVSKPSTNSWGVIPKGDSGWAYDVGDEGP